DHGFAGGYVVDGEAAIGLAAGDELGAVQAEAGDAGFSGSLDGAADRGFREGDDGDGASAGGDDAGVIGLAAEIEIDGRGGQADATARAHIFEGDFDEAGGVAIENPECFAVAGEAHGDGGVAGADASRDGEQAGFDLVDGAVGGCQDVGTGGFRAGEHLGGSGVEGDLAAGAEAGEIDDADGAGVAVGDEAVSEEALGFGPGTGRGGSGGEEQGTPRNQGTVHSAILSRGGVKRAPHVILEKARQSTRRRDGRVVGGARLESVFRGNSNVGSNPPLSAILRGYSSSSCRSGISIGVSGIRRVASDTGTRPRPVYRTLSNVSGSTTQTYPTPNSRHSAMR